MPIFKRQRHRSAVAAAAALVALVSGVVRAQPPAVAAKWVNLRAGPGRDYPLVLRVGPGSPLAVQGCTDGYGWCDVVLPGNYRGWVYAGNISYAYQQERVPLLQYGSAIGLPIIGFALGSYWGDHYRDRPFYRDRGRWEHRPMPYRGGFAGPPPGAGRPGFAGRPPVADGRFGAAGHGPEGEHRHGDASVPPFGSGGDRGPRPDLGRPAGGRPEGGRAEGGPRVGAGGRPEGDRGEPGGRGRGGGDHGGVRPGGEQGGGRGEGGRPGR